MTRDEMVVLLAKVQLGDNRQVDALVVDYWLETIGDLDFAPAMTALTRFRREHPGTYLEPGHLLALAGEAPVADPWEHLPDVTEAVMAEQKRAALETAGISEEEFDAHAHDRAWVLEHFPPAEPRAVGAGS